MLRKSAMTFLISFTILFISFPIMAQSEESSTDEGSSFLDDFDLGIGLGAEVIDGDTYQSLSFKPDLDLGMFGVGLNLKLRYTFTPDVEGDSSGEGEFSIREADWVVEDGTFSEWASLYLAKIDYLRYGHRGESLFAMAGTFDSATLGNGFVLGGYSNAVFLPEIRYFGLQLGVDGLLFNFPYVGMEAYVNDIGNFDIWGTRVFTRPLAWLELDLFNQLQIGVSYINDTNAFIRLEDAEEADAISIIDIDMLEPVLNNAIVSMAIFGDFVIQGEKANKGGMIGVGGQIFSFLNYGAQIRIMGDNFIPTYFDQFYEFDRDTKYAIIQSDEILIPATEGYFATLGTSLFENQLSLNIALEGAFGLPDDPLTNPEDSKFFNPKLTASFVIAEGLIPNMAFNAFYTKEDIESFSDLIDPTDALIGAQMDYISGPAIISFVYDVVYDPDTEEFNTTSSLQTSISLF